MDIWGETRIDFLWKRYYAFAFSGILSILGLVAVVSIPIGMASLGIDFAGGVAIQLRFDRPVAIEEVRRLLGDAGFKEADLQEFVEGNKLLIRLKKTEGEVFTGGFPDNRPLYP